jgi:hypothetical protein
LAAVVSALSLLDTLTDKDLSAADKAGGVGSAARGLGGAAGGAALGTALLPGIGTVLGALIGALIGALSGDLMGERIGRAVVRGMKVEPTGPGRPSSLSGQTRRLRIEAEGLPPGSALEIEADDPDLELDAGSLDGHHRRSRRRPGRTPLAGGHAGAGTGAAARKPSRYAASYMFSRLAARPDAQANDHHGRVCGNSRAWPGSSAISHGRK